MFSTLRPPPSALRPPFSCLVALFFGIILCPAKPHRYPSDLKSYVFVPWVIFPSVLLSGVVLIGVSGQKMREEGGNSSWNETAQTPRRVSFMKARTFVRDSHWRLALCDEYCTEKNDLGQHSSWQLLFSLLSFAGERKAKR